MMITLTLVAWLLAGSLTWAASCTKRNTPANFVGGGFLSQTEYITVHDFWDGGSGRSSFAYVRRVSDGALLRQFSLQFGSWQAITCPAENMFMVAHITTAFDQTPGVYILKPSFYFANGTLMWEVNRGISNQFWQGYMSPDCKRLLVRTDAIKSGTFDVTKPNSQQVNNFASKRDGNWMQLATPATIAYTGLGREMKKYLLLGEPGDLREKRILKQFKVQGSVRNFVISPSGRFMFATGKAIDKFTGGGSFAFKNIVSLAGNYVARTVERNLDDLEPRYTAFSPTNLQFAATFTQASGAVVKVYSTTGLNGQLQHTLIPGSTANLLYFRPVTGDKLLVFGEASANEHWMCDVA